MTREEPEPTPETPPKTCERCGARLPAGTEDCPRCLLRLGIAAESHQATEGPISGESRPGPRPGPPPTLEEVRAAFPGLEIEGLLGQGGMGAVFKARQPKLARSVALKVLSRSLGDDPSFAERFGREARALARLAHPGIVAVHDFGCSEGLHFLVMEFVDGVNLRALLRNGPMEPRQALSLARELCEALQYAHDEGVVHRDIKPENVLVDSRGRVKVADFGLAKLVDSSAEAALTRSDQVMGTPHYMAPEQLERPLEVDHRADLFALGVVLYEMLTGSLPRGNFLPPSQRVQVDVRLDSIVLKALEHEPTRRYQHALEIKTDVDHATDASGAPGPTATKPEQTKESTRVGRQHTSARELLVVPVWGWRAVGILALAWILVGLSWNLGSFAFGMGATVVVAAFWRVLAERVAAVPEWAEALRRASAGERVSRPTAMLVGGLLSIAMIGFGHLLHWEEGVHTWRPITAEGSHGLFELWARNPWSLLQLASPDGRLEEFFPPQSLPRVVVEQNTSSFELPAPWPWILILGGFVVFGLVMGASVHVRESRALGRRAWHLGAELSSYGLVALLILWVGAPISSLRSHEVLQEVTRDFSVNASEEETLRRLRTVLEEQGLEIDVEQHIRAIEERDAHELATAVLLRASSPNPFDRWSTSFSGAVRETPLLWVTVCHRLDGASTGVKVRAGLLDPRTPQFDLTLEVLRDIEASISRR